MLRQILSVLALLSIASPALADCNWLTVSNVLTTNCDVGIGTTTPARRLHIIGSGSVPAFPSGALGGSDLLVLENGGNTNLSLITGDGGNQSNIRFIRSGGAAQAGALTYLHASDSMLLLTAGSERLRIQSDGNVGIGTSAPAAKLDVGGTIHATGGVDVGGTVHAASGFVFPDGTSQVTAALGGGVKRVIRGVISFSGTDTDVAQNFSPSIDPTKSYVIVGVPVFSALAQGTNNQTRLGAGLIALTASRITIAVDYPIVGTIYPCRVSYQIIEFN